MLLRHTGLRFFCKKESTMIFAIDRSIKMTGALMRQTPREDYCVTSLWYILFITDTQANGWP